MRILVALSPWRELNEFCCPCSQLSWEVIVVDDNSPDGTQEIAKQLARVYGEDKIVRLTS